MKILIINGSPHQETGTTGRAIKELRDTFTQNDCETVVFNIAGVGKAVEGCRACGFCRKNGRCIIEDDVNTVFEQLDSVDGVVYASPVHYAGISGTLKIFLDRLHFAGGKKLQGKPGFGVVCARRAGTSAAFDQLIKYFTINNQPVVSGQYWNNVFGAGFDQAEDDKEGLQNMRETARNMVYLLKSLQAGQNAGVVRNPFEDRAWTNFMR